MKRFIYGLYWFFISPEGRINRSGFWIMMVLYTVSFYVFNILYPNLDFNQTNTLFKILFIPYIIPYFTVQIQRWHDINCRGWWCLIGIIPGIGPLITIVFNGFIKGTPSPNRFGKQKNWYGKTLN